ncbi:hypothetical protein [uncultured Arcobacter sp.]|uniref:hypothetical protein n=1 Tax=uncultured Arcobacter sp. TaxID=165434 RepID=UPI0026289DAF|nr:hypothetical protein [uncultured Arcobacter sp.]
MLNIEELLIKIMQILDFDMNDVKLKRTLEKRRFFNKELSAEKYREHIELILEKLSLDTKNNQLVDIFIDLINLYIPIYQKLNLIKFGATQKKMNWVILKRLVIPYLAKRLSSLDYDYNSRIDKGLSGGRFWYLPDITDYPNIKLPMEYIMNWWVDLYGKNLDSLCDELDNNNQSESKAFESKNTIKQWFKKSIPDRKSIEKYCSIPIRYVGYFKPNVNDTLNIQFQKAYTFVVETKKLSIDEIKHEIPYNSLVDKVFSNESISKDEKKEFVRFISERWEVPTKEKLISIFIIARGSQSIYENLLEYFAFEDSSDIEENKLLQLIYLYFQLYNENLQRYLHRVYKYDEVDIFKTNYEYLDVLNNNFLEIVTTISNDIGIELSNQNFSKTYLEDIYQIKLNVFLQNKDKRAELVSKQLKEHYEFFYEKFDQIEYDIKKYFLLSSEEKKQFINNVQDIQCLINICDREFFVNYELAEMCVKRMEILSKTDTDEIIVVSYYLKFYTWLGFEQNLTKRDEATTYIENYSKLIKNIEEKYIELLKYKLYFYIKSKQFDKALVISNEFFKRYIEAKKKDEDSIEVLILGAYIAYIEKDKKALKQYNKYLKKYINMSFQNSQSLPFKIYFYKK